MMARTTTAWAILCVLGGALAAQETPAVPIRKIEAPQETKAKKAPPFYGFEVLKIDGSKTKLDAFRGKVCLVVNTASKCGLTPQYEALEALHLKYKDQGLVILGFPANNFGGQEPGTNEEIAVFCKEKYSVSFPMFAKISVKGDDQAPLYKYLTTESACKGEVKWNFQKYLVDRNGEVVAAFEPRTKPGDEKVKETIEKALAERPSEAAKAVSATEKFVGGPKAGADALQAALARAATEDKAVLLHFSADSCGWCKKLAAFLARPEIKPIFEKDFVDLVVATDHMQDGEALLKQYAEGKPTGIPFIVTLKGDGTVIARSFDAKDKNIGYPTTAAEIEGFLAMFKGAAKRASAEDIALVKKTLEELAKK